MSDDLCILIVLFILNQKDTKEKPQIRIRISPRLQKLEEEKKKAAEEEKQRAEEEKQRAEEEKQRDVWADEEEATDELEVVVEEPQPKAERRDRIKECQDKITELSTGGISYVIRMHEVMRDFLNIVLAIIAVTEGLSPPERINWAKGIALSIGLRALFYMPVVILRCKFWLCFCCPAILTIIFVSKLGWNLSTNHSSILTG